MSPWLLLGMVLAQASYTPDEARAVYAEGVEAYGREDYAAAQEAYQRLLEHGFDGADVLFNLGTAHLARGELGPAVLYLERARRAGGGAADVDANLAFAREQQVDEVVDGRQGEPFLYRLRRSTSPVTWGWLFAGSWALGLLALCGRLLWPKRWLLPVGLLALAVALPAGALAAVHAHVARTAPEAVVVFERVEARELPTHSGQVAFEVHQGLEIRVLESAGRFVRIRLPNGLEGWVFADSVARI